MFGTGGEDFGRVAHGHGKLEASARGRMERLLRQTGVPAGLLSNGRALRLVPDGTIYRALEKLLVLDGERISYRALDVEQIGSVAGIAVLAQDTDSLDAFRVSNRAVARALQKRLGIEAPRWRAFQLAFILLNLPGLADPGDPNREMVDLLFFPTGGAKTEANLGLAAFAMVLRRLRHPGEKGLAGVRCLG